MAADEDELMAPAKGRGTVGARAMFIAIAALGVAMSAHPLAAQTRDEAQSMAADAVHRLDLQTDVDRPLDNLEPVHIKLPPEVLWLVIAVAVGILLYSMRDALLGSRTSDSWTNDETVLPEINQKDPTAILAAADELAGQGRFVEAMHVLLLRGLADIRMRLDEPFADSLTSREILRNMRLPEKVREALRDVVGRVEWTYFGENPAGREDYLACRGSFDVLEQALHGSARP
jgi:hypothetical protein